MIHAATESDGICKLKKKMRIGKKEERKVNVQINYHQSR